LVSASLGPEGESSTKWLWRALFSGDPISTTPRFFEVPFAGAVLAPADRRRTRRLPSPMRKGQKVALAVTGERPARSRRRLATA
jgi:hypothetical protein